jgi:hypothetical protein
MNTDSQKNMYDLRNREVQEIMGRIPSSIISVGSGVLLFAMVLILVSACFIRLPEEAFRNCQVQNGLGSSSGGVSSV